jgi:multidrug efflux system membrane fusion protein
LATQIFIQWLLRDREANSWNLGNRLRDCDRRNGDGTGRSVQIDVASEYRTCRGTQAKAAHHQAQLSLSDADLKAPFSGYILARNIDVGTLASPSSAVLTIADTSAVKATFGVPEDALNFVHLGQNLTLQVQNDAAQYSGRVTSISPSADARSRVFTIEVTLTNLRNTLKPGMIASVELGGRRESSQPLGPIDRGYA